MDLSWLTQLPKPVQELLVGAGANFGGGLAANTVAKLLEAAGNRVAKRLRPEASTTALKLATAEALAGAMQKVATTPEEMEHFLGMFGEWLGREEVIDELSQVIDPRAESELDLALLRREFEGLGYTADEWNGPDFAEVVADFVGRFYEAAAKQPELQAQLQIGLLRGLAEQSSRQLGELEAQSIDIGRTAVATERIAAAVSPVLTERRRQYLERIVNLHGPLPLRGLHPRFADAASGEEVPTLADVYVSLDTTATRREEDADGVDMEDAARQAREPLAALECLARSPRMVLLGDPGSGKTTFVSHLATCLAKGVLEPGRGWLDRLPGWPEPWADLVPIPVVLRDLGEWVINQGPSESRTGLLLAYLRQWLQPFGLEDLYDALAADLKQGRALLLFDGLDEVPAGTDALRRIKEMVEDVALTVGSAPVLVTCRVLSYQEDDWKLAGGWQDYEVAPLDEEKIVAFISAWYSHLEARKSRADSLAGRLERAIRQPDLWRLAGNPLLLTVMAINHSHAGGLPDARAKLYEDVVDLLLLNWESVNKDGGPSGLRELMSAAGLSDIDLKKVLWRLAFTAHDLAGDREGDRVADITAEELRNALRELHPERSLDWAEAVVAAISLRAGLLIERLPGRFSLPHRTFQEYMAGCYLGNLPEFIPRSLELAAEGAYWREVILLAIGRMVHVSGDEGRPLLLVGELCPELGGEIDEDGWRSVWLAGGCLRELGAQRAEQLATGRQISERVKDRLAALLEGGHLEPRERAEAGKVLSVLGDPRELGTLVEVPAGPFLMGSAENDREAMEREMPQHRLELPAYRIGRYPVTNGEYEAFVAASGHRPPDHWRGNSSPPELRNHPVVRVSWHDAMAYSAWLSEERAADFRLPTEAEWEKAARGADGRIFPWGNNFDRQLCNAWETGIGETSTVGSFAQGASPAGCLDMSGNVWEWTLSVWGTDSSKPDFEYPYNAEDGREDLAAEGDMRRVLRGGAFYNFRQFVRCASRFWYHPTYRYDYVGFRVLSPGL